MKKLLALGLSASLIMASATGAFAAEPETEITAGSKIVNYGFTISSPDMKMDENFEVITEGENSSVSALITANTNGEEMEISLPDYMVTTSEGVFLNLNSICSAIESLSGQEGIKDSLDSIGFNVDWIKMAELQMDEQQTDSTPYEGEIPEFTEETTEELTSILTSVVKQEETDDSITYIIDSESLSEAASQLDTFKSDNLGFIGDILTHAQESSEKSSFDIKPMISNYIDAAVDGYLMSHEDATEEEAREIINTMIDSVVSEFTSSFNTDTPDMPSAEDWNNFSFANVVKEGIGDDFSAKLLLSDEVKFEISKGANSVYGNVEMEDSIVTIKAYDQNDASLGSVVINMMDDGYFCTFYDAEDNAGLTCLYQFTNDGENIDLVCSIEDPSSETQIYFYCRTSSVEDNGLIPVPDDYIDVLDVVRVATAIFTATTEAETE